MSIKWVYFFIDINNNNASDRTRADSEGKDIMECSQNVRTSTFNISPKAAIETEYQDMQIVPKGANISAEVDLVSLKSNEEEKDVNTNNTKDSEEIDTMEKEKGIHVFYLSCLYRIKSIFINFFNFALLLSK